MKKIERALISVFDKRGIADFARKLRGMGIEIVSTGSTAGLLEKEGIAVTKVSEVTGFPEIMDGRVKTLHPKIHGGLLAIRENPDHMGQLAAHGIQTIDLVAVNLYPFVETTRRPGVRFEDVIENIDIGGPSMLRAAAKNFQDVAVITDPADYGAIIEEISAGGGKLTRERLFALAQQAFRHTALYDRQISEYLAKVTVTPDGFRLPEDGPGAATSIRL